MDKPTTKGGRQPAIEWLQFGRLRSVEVLETRRLQDVRGRANRLDPYDVMWLGDVDKLGESFLLLTDPYFLPTAYLDLQLEEYGGEFGVPDGEMRATPQRNDSRLGRLDDEQVALLKRKLIAYWTRLQLKAEELPS
jgi:hypothetical protein